MVIIISSECLKDWLLLMKETHLAGNRVWAGRDQSDQKTLCSILDDDIVILYVEILYSLLWCYSSLSCKSWCSILNQESYYSIKIFLGLIALLIMINLILPNMSIEFLRAITYMISFGNEEYRTNGFKQLVDRLVECRDMFNLSTNLIASVLTCLTC